MPQMNSVFKLRDDVRGHIIGLAPIFINNPLCRRIQTGISIYYSVCTYFSYRQFLATYGFGERFPGDENNDPSLGVQNNTHSDADLDCFLESRSVSLQTLDSAPYLNYMEGYFGASRFIDRHLVIMELGLQRLTF